MVSLSTMMTLALVVLGGADAYAFGPSTSKGVRFSPTYRRSVGSVHRCREDGSPVTLYLFPSPPSVSAANYKRSKRSSPASPMRKSSSLPAMSPSVLADSDTLPSFHTAHGLLSPEVVMRIADSNDLEEGGALHKFLVTYKRKGPMACIPMLSDPSILPELTSAMREIA
jgi:hypothetical protein